MILNYRFSKIIFIFLISIACGFDSYAQSVAINTDGAVPNSSSIVDISSTSKGMLIPRLTEAQRTAILQPAKSLLVYQVDATEGFYFNKGNALAPKWILMGEVTPAVAFAVKSNTAIVQPNTNYTFLQTIEDFDLSSNFRLNGSLVNPNSFIVPYNGIYTFSGSIIWTINPGDAFYAYTEIRVNGISRVSVYNWAGNNADFTSNINGDLKLNAGDIVNFGCKHTGVDQANIFGTVFSGHLLIKF